MYSESLETLSKKVTEASEKTSRLHDQYSKTLHLSRDCAEMSNKLSKLAGELKTMLDAVYQDEVKLRLEYAALTEEHRDRAGWPPNDPGDHIV